MIPIIVFALLVNMITSEETYDCSRRDFSIKMGSLFIIVTILVIVWDIAHKTTFI